MKIRQKLLSGFLAVALLVATAGAVGFLTSNTIGASTDRIGEEMVPVQGATVQAIIMLQEAQTAAQSIVGQSEGVDAAASKIEDASIEFDMWMNALALGTESREFRDSDAMYVYNELGRGLIVPQATGEVLAQTESAHRAYGSFAEAADSLVGQRSAMLEYYFDYEGRTWNIENFVTLVELQHLKWIDDLGSAALLNQRFTGETDPTQCFFGRWLYNYTVNDPEVVAILADIEPLHRDLHRSAVEINQIAGSASKLALFNSRIVELKEQIRSQFEVLSGYLGPQLATMESEQLSTVAILNAAAANTAGALNDLELVVESEMNDALTAADGAQSAGLLILVVVVAVSVLVAVVIGLTMARSISNPLTKVTVVSEEIAAGNFQVENAAVRSKDEIGQLSTSFQRMLDSLKRKVSTLQSVAAGDLSVNVENASSRDELGIAMNTMVRNLRQVIQDVQDASDQVASGSSQIAASSQQLSSGATQQASSIEEVSASVNQVSGQSRRNAEGAAKAREMAQQANAQANSGDEQMAELRHAMEDISGNSEEIKKIVKVIDDIAFQINLLALNANVEAARAGKYGKGFAVVAEEVRNLATRSAEAVKETAVMVDRSVASISDGSRITEETGQRLTEIVAGVSGVADVLSEIAASSREQAEALEQITEGLNQIDQVTQANTATAEESAAAAEELSSQSQQLIHTASSFRLSTALSPAHGVSEAVALPNAADGAEENEVSGTPERAPAESRQPVG